MATFLTLLLTATHVVVAVVSYAYSHRAFVAKLIAAAEALGPEGKAVAADLINLVKPKS